jgi:AcrR family transcriptional regulator
MLMNAGRKEKERELRVQLILEAGEKVFGRKPYSNASMLEIANEAQLGMQSLYNVFPSKKELYEGLINCKIRKYQAELDSLCNHAKNPIDAIKHWILIHFKTMMEYPAFYPVFLKEKINYEWKIESPVLPVLRATFEIEEKRLLSLLEKAQNAGLLKPMPVYRIKGIFFSFLQAQLEYNFRQKKSKEVKECVEETMDLFLNGLKA